MVNPSSKTFKISEKIGLIIGKGIRYILVGAIIMFLGEKFKISKKSSPVPEPPSPSKL
jgi:hypothetical protein